jgi:spermidine/putrescine-binding protein
MVQPRTCAGWFVEGLLLLFPVFLSVPTVSAHADKDVLRLLIWEGYAPQEYVKGFEKRIEAKYGRKVKLDISFVRGSDDYFAPVRTKRVDLVTISHHLFKDIRFNYIGKQLLVPLDLKNIPDYENLVDALKRDKYHISKGELYGVPVAQGPYGLAYNTEKSTSAPSTWRVFWDPKLRGKYVLGAHEYLYNVSIVALALGYPRDSINNYDTLNNDQFKEKLREFAVNAHSFWIGQDKVNDLLGMTLATSWGDSFTSLRERGKTWKMADPKEGTPWWIDDYAITWSLEDKPFLKKVAEEWINEALKPDFQVENIIRDLTIHPVTTNINDRLSLEERQRLGIDRPGSFTEKRILQQTMSRRDRNGLRLLWDEATQGIEFEEGGD